MKRCRKFVCFLMMALVGMLGGGISAKAAEPTIVQIDAGGKSAFALFSNGDLYGWGENKQGQLGDGTTKVRSKPMKIGTGFTRVIAKPNYTMALKGTTLYAWGENTRGQLGDGTTVNRYAPVKIGTGFTQVESGSDHTLALKGDVLYAWGSNVFGQVGDGTEKNRNKPVKIGAGYTQISAGNNYSFALKGDALYSWGLNNFGELGDGTRQSRCEPMKIGTGFTQVYATSSPLALKGDALYSWGSSAFGALGDGTNEARYQPVKIGTGFSRVIETGESCAVKGEVLYQWGLHGLGDIEYPLMFGGALYYSNKPAKIGSGFTQVVAESFCGLGLKGNELYSWGRNIYLQLGDPELTMSKPFKLGDGYTQIEMGGGSCYAAKGSELYAWGLNDYYQLGDGTKTARSRPRRVEFPEPVPPTSIALSQEKLDVAKGDTIALNATLKPNNAIPDIAWKSSNGKIASVDKGVVYAKQYGVATITATTSNGITAQCVVTVVPAKVTQKKPSVSGNKATLTWSAINDVQGYKIAYSKNGGEYMTFSDVKNANSFTTDALPKGTYSFKIRAYTKIDGASKYGKYSDAMEVMIK